MINKSIYTPTGTPVELVQLEKFKKLTTKAKIWQVDAIIFRLVQSRRTLLSAQSIHPSKRYWLEKALDCIDLEIAGWRESKRSLIGTYDKETGKITLDVEKLNKDEQGRRSK